MYVCICNSVTERDIHNAVAAGCDSMRELKRQLGVATECGRCTSCARDVLRQARSASTGTKITPAAMATA
jgi:bacterioferritin-associated ferredoxin